MTTHRNPRTPVTFTKVQLAYVTSATARADKLLWHDPWEDELRSDIGWRLATDIERIMLNYPNPDVWVAAILPNLRIDVVRRNNAQRGSGARNTRRVGELDEVAINEFEMREGYTAPADSRVGDVSHPMELIPQATLARLGQKQASLFRMREIEGFTTAEAAESVGTTPNNASRLIAGAKRILNEEFGEE